MSGLELLGGGKVAVIGHRVGYLPVDVEREDFGGILAVYDLHSTDRLTNKSIKCDDVEVEFICDGMTIITLNGKSCIAVSTCNT